MKSVLFLLCFLVFSYGTILVEPIKPIVKIGGFSWQTCGSSSDHYQVDSVVMAPYPAMQGQNVTVHAHGSQDETVSGGTWQTKVYLDGWNVQTITGGVCDLIPNCPCPCPAGSYTTSQSVYVPSFSPSGTYTGKYTASDQNGEPLTCISYTFQIGN